MKNGLSKKNLFGIVALAMICVLLGTGIGLTNADKAIAAEGGTKIEGVVSSPFTAAVEAVHSSVVGISNYKTYQTNNYGSNYGFGFGFDFGFGGRGNKDNGGSGETRDVKAATGSGTVISNQGHVLTNYHVVEGASYVKVTVNEKEYDAQIIAYDVDMDIAILQSKDINLTPVSLGDSDALRIGDWAICIGNPLDETLVGTTTAGIVSGLNRAISTGTTTDKYGRYSEIVNSMIQVDASINSGNSGGGMFNVLGELVGIPTIKYSSNGFFSSSSIEGIGMCIPINAAKPLIEKVLSGEITAENPEQKADATVPPTNQPKVKMGVSIIEINGADFNTILPSGSYVHAVDEGSPAEKGGILPGDIIVEADGEIVASTKELQDAVGKHEAGDTVKIVVYRAEGLYDVMERVFNRESVTFQEFPTNGEYVELTVGVITNEITVQQ